jgi:hypothetical protein
LRKSIIIILLLFIGILLNVGIVSASSEWWNSSWGYRKLIDVYNYESAGNKTIYFNLSWQVGMEPGYCSIRFVDLNNSIVYPHFINNSVNYSWFSGFVNITSLPSGASQLYVYWGNLNATCEYNETQIRDRAWNGEIEVGGSSGYLGVDANFDTSTNQYTSPTGYVETTVWQVDMGAIYRITNLTTKDKTNGGPYGGTARWYYSTDNSSWNLFYSHSMLTNTDTTHYNSYTTTINARWIRYTLEANPGYGWVYEVYALQQNNASISWNATSSEPVVTFSVTISPSERIEGGLVYAYASFSLASNATLNSVSFILNNTSTNAYNDSGIWKPVTGDQLMAPGPVDAYNSTFAVYAEVNVSYANTTLYPRHWANLLVHKITMANGTPSWINASTLRFELYDETTNANVTGNLLQAAFTLTYGSTSRTTAFNESNRQNFTFYIYPSWASYICDAQVVYAATGYSPRTHYLSQATINNQTQVVKLMLANSSATTKIDIYVKEPNSIEAPNVVIQIQKYDVGTATYTTVQTVQTDYAGHAIAYLQLDQWYRFIFIRNGKVIKSTDPIQLTTNSYTFYLDFEGVEPYQYYGKFAYSVEYLTATRTLRVIASDTSGLMQSVTLKIDRKYPLNYTNIYDHTESGSSVTLLYTFPNETATYSYSAVANFQSTKLALGSGIIEVNPAGAQLGTTGLLMATFTIMALGLIGIWSPSACVALSTLGVIVSYWLGLIAVTFSAVVGLVASAAILIYKLKD